MARVCTERLQVMVTKIEAVANKGTLLYVFLQNPFACTFFFPSMIALKKEQELSGCV